MELHLTGKEGLLVLQEKLLSGVDRDLAPFAESGITLEMVEQVYCTYNVQSFRVHVGPGSGQSPPPPK